jgi:exopolysaccharide biosynthesis polyprenyl glycosylphosphotransferase
MSQIRFDVPERESDDSSGVPRAVATNAPAPIRNPHWTRQYRRRLIATDTIIVVAAMLAPVFLFQKDADGRAPFISIAVVLWLAALTAFDSRTSRTMGAGATEYKAVIDATLVFLGVLVIAALVLGTEVGRTDIIPSLPLGLVGLLLSRWGWRQWLRRRRNTGEYVSRVVLFGSNSTINHTSVQLARHPDAGYLVVATVVPDLHPRELDPSNDVDEFAELELAMRRFGADTVMVTSSDHLTPDRMRRLSWHLEHSAHRLVISPSLNEVAGSRIQTQPIAGLPLIHIERPNYTGPQRLVKRGVDIVGSLGLLIVLSPVFVGVALLNKLLSPGPVFYQQERIGRRSQSFSILKFRSMVVDADARLEALLAEQGDGATPLFKLKSDPRLTPIGAILRRYSIDELPQLINVLRGDMSLVGPRPQRPAEVALYDTTATRRLAVRPGMSGLWQVSGRSRLTWDEALRLDLYYIENWSLAADLVILWRTAKAVVSSDGAY